MLSAFGRILGPCAGALVLTCLCDSRRSAATRSEFLFPNACSPNRNSPPDPFLGTEDTALSCSAVQDLDKNMLDEDEARL